MAIALSFAQEPIDANVHKALHYHQTTRRRTPLSGITWTMVPEKDRPWVLTRLRGKHVFMIQFEKVDLAQPFAYYRVYSPRTFRVYSITRRYLLACSLLIPWFIVCFNNYNILAENLGHPGQRGITIIVYAMDNTYFFNIYIFDNIIINICMA